MPDFGIWGAVNGNWTLYQPYLDRIYNDPAVAGLAPLSADGRKIFWAVNYPRPWEQLSIFHPPDSAPELQRGNQYQSASDHVGGHVYFDVNQTSAKAVASNGGRNDVLVQWMWQAEPVPSWWNQSLDNRQSWTYLGSCADPNVQPRVPCQSSVQNETALGRVMTVSANTVLDSVAFASPGKQQGLALKSQFLSVF